MSRSIQAVPLKDLAELRHRLPHSPYPPSRTATDAGTDPTTQTPHAIVDNGRDGHDRCRAEADLGYEGEADTDVVAFKKPKNGELTDLQQTFNRAHNRIRAVGKRGNSLLKMTFKALRTSPSAPGRPAPSSLPPWVILHIEHGRTT